MSIMNTNFVGFRFGENSWNHNGLNTSKILSKFIFCWKNIISIALAISHSCLYLGKRFKNFSNIHEGKLLILTTMDCFTIHLSKRASLAIKFVKLPEGLREGFQCIHANPRLQCSRAYRSRSHKWRLQALRDSSRFLTWSSTTVKTAPLNRYRVNWKDWFVDFGRVFDCSIAGLIHASLALS